MRIALSQSYEKKRGGHGAHPLFVHGLLDDGHDVIMFSGRDDLDQYASLRDRDGMRFISYPRFIEAYGILRTFFRVITLSFLKIDVLDVHSGSPVMEWMFLKLFRPSMITTARFLKEHETHVDLQTSLLFRYCDMLVVEKTAQKKIAKKWRKKGTAVIPIGRVYKKEESERWKNDLPFGLQVGEYILMHTNMHRDREVAQKIVRSYEHLRATNKIPNHFSLVLIAENPLEDDARAILDSLEVSIPRFHVVRSSTRKDRSSLASCAGIFVWQEGVCAKRSAEDALAYGVPVVAFGKKDMGSIKNCVLQAKEQVSMLSEMLAYALNVPKSQRNTFSQAGKKRIRKYYDWSSVVKRTIGLYHDTLAVRRMGSHAWKFSHSRAHRFS